MAVWARDNLLRRSPDLARLKKTLPPPVTSAVWPTHRITELGSGLLWVETGLLLHPAFASHPHVGQEEAVDSSAPRRASCSPTKTGPARLAQSPQQLTDSLLASRSCEISPQQWMCIGVSSAFLCVSVCVCVFVSLLVQTRFQFDVQRFRSDPTSSRTRFVSLSRVAEASQSSEDLEPGGNVQVSLQTSNPQQALELECEFVWWRFLYHLSCEEQEVKRNIWQCFSLHRRPSRLAPHSGILKHSETGQHSGRCCHVFYVCS